jgi:hypothetical protein
MNMSLKIQFSNINKIENDIFVDLFKKMKSKPRLYKEDHSVTKMSDYNRILLQKNPTFFYWARINNIIIKITISILSESIS